MTSFDFIKGSSNHGLKQAMIEELVKHDLDSQAALKLIHADDIATLELTLGQRRLLLHAVEMLNGTQNEACQNKNERGHPGDYQVIGKRWRLGRPLEKDRRSFAG